LETFFCGASAASLTGDFAEAAFGTTEVDAAAAWAG
jgi:hypothetical protein